MADVLIRGIADKTHRELKRRAKAHGRSVNAEVLAMLDTVAYPTPKTGLVAELEAIKKKYLHEGENFTFAVERDRTPARFVDFSGPEYAEFDEPETK